MGLSSKAERALEQSAADAKYVGRRAARTARLAGDDVTGHVRDLLDDIENVLQHSQSANLDALRDELRGKLRSAREDLGDVRASLRRKADAALHDADAYVHERPWQTIGAVAGIALLLGFLVGRS